MASEEGLSPREARLMFRSGKAVGKLTSGLFGGFLQANLAVFDCQLADSFALFCKRNSAACPVVFMSKRGEVAAGELAEDSDVRTDLPLYRVWQSGKLIEKTDSLMKYSWENKVSFYIGCSFGFEKPLQDEGVPVRNVEQQCNVSMFRTNIPCHSVEPFHNNLVVAMRPIPQDLLKACVETTQRLTGIHGGPIHIGNPEIIGIKDLSNPDYGDVLQFHDGDIPVFWGCGVTAIEAIIAAEVDLAFTHSPGCMFVCDVPYDYGGQDSPPTSVEIVNMTVPGQVFSASVVSMSVAEKIRHLQKHTSELFDKDELLISVCSLSHSRSVAVAIQSCLSGDELGGLGVLVYALSSCGVKTIISSNVNYCHMQSDLQQLLSHGTITNEVELAAVVTTRPVSAIESDCAVIISDSGELNAVQAEKSKAIIVGSGSDSNEDGSHILVKGKPAAVLSALALSLALLQTCPVHVRYTARGICEEPVEVVTVSDLFSSVTKKPEGFDELLTMIST